MMPTSPPLHRGMDKLKARIGMGLAGLPIPG